jgi:hypothetical protein
MRKSAKQGETDMAEKMNPEVKAQWVAALRSGEYKQTKGHLKQDGGHCCLGVLCDLYAKQSGIQSWTSDDFGHADDKELAGERVLAWSGLRHQVYVDIGEDRALLHIHNDKERTFDEIADAIEAQL